MSYEKLPPLENPGFKSNCLNCGEQDIRLPMDAIMATGFGSVVVLCDGKEFWSGDDENLTLKRFERHAAKKPKCDWRVAFYGPMSETEYQRQGRAKWILIRRGEGFA